MSLRPRLDRAAAALHAAAPPPASLAFAPIYLRLWCGAAASEDRDWAVLAGCTLRRHLNDDPAAEATIDANDLAAFLRWERALPDGVTLEGLRGELDAAGKVRPMLRELTDHDALP